ncbi:uncharacterized protein [Clytia hemisphaerica]
MSKIDHHYVKRSILTLLLLFVGYNDAQKEPFTITRQRHGISDKLTLIPDISRPNLVKNEFENLGMNRQCLTNGVARTIASSVGGASKLNCYTGQEYQSQETCSNGFLTIAAESQTSSLRCKVSNINDIYIWDRKELLKINFKDLEDELEAKDSYFVFKTRSKWDGLLVQILYQCQSTTANLAKQELCTVMKFTGIRHHPLPNKIEEILYGDDTRPFTPTPTIQTTGNNTTIVVAKSQKLSNGIPTGTIIGISIAIVIVLVAALLIVALACYRKRKKSRSDKHKDPAYNSFKRNRKEQNLNGETSTLYTEPKNFLPEYKELEPGEIQKKNQGTLNSDTYHYSRARDTTPRRINVLKGNHDNHSNDSTLSGGYSTVKDVDLNQPKNQPNEAVIGHQIPGNEYAVAPIEHENSTQDNKMNHKALDSGYSSIRFDQEKGKTALGKDSKKRTLNYYSTPISDRPETPPEIAKLYTKVNKKR